MIMSDKMKDEKMIEDLLRRSMEQDAPLGLKREIMKRINKRNPRLHRRLAEWFMTPLNLRFSPAGALLAAVIVSAAFLGGIMVERNTANTAHQADGIARYADDAHANYRVGRSLLAENQQEEALRFFRKAVELNPQNPEYVHWQGVAYWALDNRELERQSYFQTVRNHPDFLPSLLNLGHSYLESGNFQAALQQYQQVLRIDPDVPEALYNSALAYRKLNNETLQIQAFKRYLATYRTGKWAHRAVEHLHQLGDYSYRSYRIGIHRIILATPGLLQTVSSPGNQEVEYLAGVVRRMTGEELHIIAYNKDDKNEARESALNLQRLLLDRLDPEHADLVRLSWFGAPETITAANGENLQLSPSILIFSNPIISKNRRNST